MKFICNTIIVGSAIAMMCQAHAQEKRLLQENEISEAVVINALAPEKSGRTRSFKPLGEEQDAKVSAPSASILITFNTNSAELTHSAKEALDKIGRALNMDKHAEFSFTIEGHADLSGTYQFNQVDVYVPGCPPTAEALIYGIIQLQQKIRRTNTIARA